MMMTIAEFQKAVDDYQKARNHTAWLVKNLDKLPVVKTKDAAKTLYTQAVDQEQAALRDLLNAARRMQA